MGCAASRAAHDEPSPEPPPPVPATIRPHRLKKASRSAGSGLTTVSPVPPDNVWTVGERVEARWKRGGYYRGKIDKVNQDGTYAVAFDDGDYEPSEHAAWIRAEPHPSVLRATGAGSPAANGLYHEEGTYQGCARFVHEKGLLCMIRYRLPSGRDWWYIADKTRLNVAAGDLYRIQSDAATPPLDCPWTVAYDGVAPGPVVSEVDAAGNSVRHEPGKRAVGSRHYVGSDALASMLRCGDIALVRASYVLRLHASGGVLPRRQDLPAGALADAAMIERLVAELDACRGRGAKTYEMKYQGLVVVSYAWGAKEHPDGEGHMLARTLAPACEWYLSERCRLLENGGCRGSDRGGWWSEPLDSGRLVSDEDFVEAADFGLFLDYASMYQRPRSEEEDAAFQRALNGMDLLYAHRHSIVWRLTASHGGLPYAERGWPFFETSVASLSKPMLGTFDLGRVDFSRPLDRWAWSDDEGEFVCGAAAALRAAAISAPAAEPIRFEGVPRSKEQLVRQGSYTSCFRVGVLGGMIDRRPPPPVPVTFAAEVHQRTFTNRADVLAVVALHSRVATSVIGSLVHMSCDTMGWTARHVPALLLAVQMARQLQNLNLEYNLLGDEGAFALAAGFVREPCAPNLAYLNLSINRIGDDGVVALASMAAQRRALPKLTKLVLNRNPFGEAGVAAVEKLRATKAPVNVVFEKRARPRAHQRDQPAAQYVSSIL